MNPPGSTYTTAGGLNNTGVVVGAFELPGQTLSGFTYKVASNQYHPLNVPGAVYTTALAVNDSNTIVGTFANSDGVVHGYFNHNGKFTQYDVPGSTGTTVQGINNAGDFTGTVGANGFYSGYVSIGGTVTQFQVNGLVTDAYAINSSGSVVGFFINAAATKFHGYVRDSAGNITQIDFPGSVSTACTGINDAGTITGFYEDVTSQNHGFILANGKYLASTLPYIAGVNNKSEYVGSTAGKSGQTLGFLARGKQ